MLSRFPRFSGCELRWQLSFIFDALVPCEVPVASSCMIGATAVNTLYADQSVNGLKHFEAFTYTNQAHMARQSKISKALQMVGLWYRSLTVADLTHSFLCVSLRPTRSWCMWVAVASKCDKVCMLQASQPSIWFSFDRFFLFSIFLCLNLCFLHSQTLVAHGSSTFLHEAKPQVQMWWCQRLDAGSTVGNPTYSP